MLLIAFVGFGSGGTLTVAMAVSVTRGSEKGTIASSHRKLLTSGNLFLLIFICSGKLFLLIFIINL